jgi:hypothetical protein
VESIARTRRYQLEIAADPSLGPKLPLEKLWFVPRRTPSHRIAVAVVRPTTLEEKSFVVAVALQASAMEAGA